MSNLTNICNKLSIAVDGILSVALIDIKDGNVMAISDSDNNNEQLKNNISSTVLSIFKNSSVNKIERFLSDIKGKESKDPFKEIFISSNTNFYFMRLLEELKLVMFIISKKTINQGLIWSEIKRAALEIKDKE